MPNTNEQRLNAWFASIKHKINNQVPNIVAETAVEYFKESFRTKSFDGVKWKETKRKVARGSLMVRSGALMSTIRPSEVNTTRVRISAGSSKVPYAKIHNEGGQIRRAARSETFTRNRFKAGAKKGRFKRGTASGNGFSFKAYEYNMPKRQFMGHAAELNKRIITRLKGVFNTR